MAALVLLFFAGLAFLYQTIPQHRGTNRDSAAHFDAIIVLGSPANPDGSPGPEQRERTLEGVREYKAGVAPHLIMSGGAAHNQYAEGHVMADLAEHTGVPKTAIVEEDSSQNTIQNAYYSVKIMQSRGWRSAEVVSSPSHLPRASLIFRRFPIEWRMHPAPWPAGHTPLFIAELYLGEALYCSKLRLFGFQPTRFLPESDSQR